MKMSIKKSKIVIYLIIGYLIATWGVNRNINPVVYFQTMLSEQKTAVELMAEGNELSIRLEETAEDFPYVCFYVADSEEYSLKVGAREFVGEEEKISNVYSLERGWNRVRIQDKEATEVSFTSKNLEKNAAQIDKVYQTAFPMMDLLKTLEVYVSFIVLVVVWECIQYIKRKYTCN